MRVLAALSGGVDSAVAAARLVRDGADVVGVHLRTGVEGAGGAAGGRSCCGVDDARDARAVAARLGIPFYVVDVRDAFRAVLDEFVAAHRAGTTPNPCVTCNREVKFGRLLDVADGLGAGEVATGHYARVEPGPAGRRRLLRGRDARKDQSYVLYPLSQAQLARARFPLGDSRKEDVRREAALLGLPVAAKPDSQELCFVPDGDHRAWLRRHAPTTLVPGQIVDSDGRVVGTHAGAAGYTVGQRRGLPALGAPRYVARVDAPGGRIEVAPRADLLARRVRASDVRWVEEPSPPVGARRRVDGRIRHAAPVVPATLEATGPDEVEVVFDDPVFAPAPGQALVAYVGDAVLCGGTIVGARRD